MELNFTSVQIFLSLYSQSRRSNIKRSDACRPIIGLTFHWLQLSRYTQVLLCVYVNVPYKEISFYEVM